MKIFATQKVSGSTPTLHIEGKPALLSASGKVSGHMMLSFPTDKPVREASTPPMQWDLANGREMLGGKKSLGKRITHKTQDVSCDEMTGSPCAPSETFFSSPE